MTPVTDPFQRPMTSLRAASLTLAALFVCNHLAYSQEASTELPQAPTPNAVWLSGSGIAVEHASAGPMPLSLDEAIDRGLKHNLQIELSQENERDVHGQYLSVANALLPSLTAKAQASAQQLDLEALGFKPASVEGLLPPGISFSPIVKVNTATAEIALDQQLFNAQAYYLYRSAKQALKAASFATHDTRENITLRVGSQYLLALADAAQIDNARALAKADDVAYQQAVASHDAGVGTNLDVLRARVQLQTQQQAVINDENAFAKDKIALNRLIGLPADQEINLTDTAPYSEIAELSLEDARKLAYERRQDLENLEAQLQVAIEAKKAVRAERYPSLAFNGYYGVLGEIGGLYHGVFAATGKVSVPVFEEGALRGQREVADAQITGLKQQIDSLRSTIEQQIRSSMLDIQSNNDLVKVARSNVDLASQELSDATDRFSAGVDDNLPVVQAQATLAQAQSQLVSTLYQYNQSKLQLAKNTGVAETQYKVYLGR